VGYYIPVGTTTNLGEDASLAYSPLPGYQIIATGYKGTVLDQNHNWISPSYGNSWSFFNRYDFACSHFTRFHCAHFCSAATALSASASPAPTTSVSTLSSSPVVRRTLLKTVIAPGSGHTMKQLPQPVQPAPA